MRDPSKKPQLGVPIETYRAWEAELRDECPSPEAWRRLLLSLRFGKAVFTDNGGDARIPVGMDGVVHVITEIMEFLHAHEIVNRQQLSDPLGRLSHALVDLGNGRKPGLFTPVAVGMGGRPDPVAEQNLQVLAARALHELFLQNGSRRGTKSAAAETVAAAVRHGRIPGHEKCTAENVIRWLERIESGKKGKVKVTAALLARWHTPLPTHVGITNQERADFLLNALREGRSFRWK